MTGLLLSATALALVLSVATAPGAAHAEPAPSPPPPSATPAPGSPTITSPAPGTLVTTGTVTVSGTGNPGDRIGVFVDAHGPACQATVDPASVWSCTVPTLSDGPDVIIGAVVTGDTDRSDSVSVAVLSPPTISGGSNGFLSSGGVHGTGYPGATVTVTAAGGATCTFPVDSAGSWACVLSGPPPSGTYAVSATQTAPFSTESSRASTPVGITIDSTAPARPQLAWPAPNSTVPHGRAGAFGGTGENRAHVTVYGGDDAGSAVICRTIVAQGAWSCNGTLPPGRYTVSALQSDPAGNVSPASAAITLTFAAAPPAAPGAHAASPAPSPSSSAGQSAQPVPTAPSSPTPSARPPHATHGGLQTWSGASQFTNATPPTIAPAAIPGWLRSVLLAAAALLLLALPARLLATTLARARLEHPAAGRHRFFGRNRPRSEVEADADPDAHPAGILQRRLAAGSGFVAAAALVTLSSPVGSSPAGDVGTYVRVLIAVLIALAIVNAAWIAIPRFASVHLTGAHAVIAFQPRNLLVVAVAAVASRIFDLQPALLFGLLVGAVAMPGVTGGAAESVRRSAQGRLAAAQVAGLAGVGVLAWLALGLIPDPSDPLSAFVTELAGAITLLALGSAGISLLPVGALAGRAVFLWSRRVWVALSLAVYTVLFALLLPVQALWNAGTASVVLVVGVIVFAAFSVAFWLWERFVEPARQS
ncbi:hypothetical protein G3T36_15195 [Diaminobutyricibacter tongyongensis]|uniref:Bacterial Ig-like domain-containing protein n=1 Tax=Leifsonia tongyongensis TaxID=1268043 RepID=A0A6L9Y0V6_9MICO|nr:hypothetical protein [Diaminobutyricibacter tongyongensis]NEN07206.1 hypothetical protein [Diaminobutyricibacter tongyongensis]